MAVCVTPPPPPRLWQGCYSSRWTANESWLGTGPRRSYYLSRNQYVPLAFAFSLFFKFLSKQFDSQNLRYFWLSLILLGHVLGHVLGAGLLHGFTGQRLVRIPVNIGRDLVQGFYSTSRDHCGIFYVARLKYIILHFLKYHFKIRGPLTHDGLMCKGYIQYLFYLIYSGENITFSECKANVCREPHSETNTPFH